MNSEQVPGAQAPETIPEAVPETAPAALDDLRHAIDCDYVLDEAVAFAALPVATPT